MFLFKKIVAPFFLPTTLIFLFLLIGIVFLWFTKKEKIGKTFVTVGFMLLTLFSYGIFTNLLFSNGLEQEYPPMLTISEAAGASWVVVLGGGVSPDDRLPGNDQLAKSSLSRLIEGIRIYRQLPKSRLILMGGAGFGSTVASEVMAETAVSLGVNRHDILIETNSRDTKDQARDVKKIVGPERFVIVTSAVHMPRVIALFKNQGLTPIPAPTDFWIKKRQDITPSIFFPGADNLKMTERVVHEYLGLIWAKLRGQA
jgi:uncharacterized SAM-binding protein YcdF (DUF218 family)